MRNALKYGIPAAAGLGAAGLVASQGGNPVEAGGAAIAAGLGGAAGLIGARQLAGRYNPQLMQRISGTLSDVGNRVGDYGRNLPDDSIVRKRGTAMAADAVSAVDNRLMGVPGERNAAIPFPTQGVQRNIGKAAAAGLVPASAATAALGGYAAGQAVGAVGQMIGIDPELPGSSNTVNSRLNMQGMNYLPMY
jgi:hypothetical protein